MTLQTLSLAQRLALSYAPAASREDVLAILLLDDRLAGILRDKGEVMIAQIKLAWWRDRLGDDPQNWPLGEPLLERLRSVSFDPALLQPLVNGWERLLDEQLTSDAVSEFAQGRASAWAALPGGAGNKPEVEECARHWALADLALNIGNDEEAGLVLAVMATVEARRAVLPRRLRPLAVLHGLTLRALQKDCAELLDGPGAAMLALRIGLFGR